MEFKEPKFDKKSAKAFSDFLAYDNDSVVAQKKTKAKKTSTKTKSKK